MKGLSFETEEYITLHESATWRARRSGYDNTTHTKLSTSPSAVPFLTFSTPPPIGSRPVLKFVSNPSILLNSGNSDWITSSGLKESEPAIRNPFAVRGRKALRRRKNPFAVAKIPSPWALRRRCRRPCWPRAVPSASAAHPHVSWPRAAR